MDQHRLIFLDVDGVLIIDGGGTHGYETPDPILVARVKRLVASTRARIVLGSLWRFSAKKRRLLTNLGITLHACTPELSGQGRAAEISAFVAEYRRSHADIEIDYVILDDDDGAEIAGHYYGCRPDEGFSDQVYQSVLRRWPVLT